MAGGFILHLSDFHIRSERDQSNCIKKAFEKLSNTLKLENIKIDYLFITGDIIDSKNLHITVATNNEASFGKYIIEEGSGKKAFNQDGFKKEASSDNKKAFDNLLIEEIKERFNCAREIISDLIDKLDITVSKVVVCCGNHDTFYPFSYDCTDIICGKNESGNMIYNGEIFKEILFSQFNSFVTSMNFANKKCNHDGVCCLENLNVLVLNTNWPTPRSMKKENSCVYCELIKNVDKDKYNSGLNVILAHKPLYEICEEARLPYSRYSNADFMKRIKEFLGTNGVYFCGDKHTRSILGENFHDIPHYICGEPFYLDEGKKLEFEYNLVQVLNNSIGAEKKVHLEQKDNGEWKCTIRPQDKVVAELFELSKPYIRNNYATIVGNLSIFESWENTCSEIYEWKKTKNKCSKSMVIYDQLVAIFQIICKYREEGKRYWHGFNIFRKAISAVVHYEKGEKGEKTANRNIMNIKGEHGSGKSIFLAYFFGSLLYYYYFGNLGMLPCYFNLNAKETWETTKKGETYYSAVKSIFEKFINRLAEIANKEQQNVCLIIDGLEEQDCWSFSTEDSVGRAILDIISKHENIHYIMSFSQSKVPYLKNTMPAIEYGDISDLIFFNPMNIQYDNIDALNKYLESCRIIGNLIEQTNSNYTYQVNDDCSFVSYEQIKQLNKTTVNFQFLYENNAFLKELLDNQNIDSSKVYSYYISHNNQICRNEIGYDFIDFAPDIAYLFSYRGYTYEHLARIETDESIAAHISNRITSHHDGLYNAFRLVNKNKDVRDYLVALHYNREMRYYVENPNIEINKKSILNDFITNDVVVYINNQWSDSNKFLIACSYLLQRKEISYHLLLMLMYIVHCITISPFDRASACDSIKEAYVYSLPNSVSNFESIPICDNDHWKINGYMNNSESVNHFHKLSCLRTIVLYSYAERNEMEMIYKLFIDSDNFKLLNRQFLMLYYGDITIKGGQVDKVLVPGKDIIYDGFDFFNTFNALYSKVITRKNDPLYIFNLLTLVDLILSRLFNNSNEKSMFNNNKHKVKRILNDIVEEINKFIRTESLYENGKAAYEYLAEKKDVICKYAIQITDSTNYDTKL